MKFGIAFANAGPLPGRRGAVDLARVAEAAGSSRSGPSSTCSSPPATSRQYPYDPSGRMPGRRRRLRPARPADLAGLRRRRDRPDQPRHRDPDPPPAQPGGAGQGVATLDAMSGGRVLLGIGVGWLKEEFDALGVPFDDRGRRTDEYVGAMRALWPRTRPARRRVRVVLEGREPSQAGRRAASRSIIGGHTEPAARRAGRLGDGFFPGKGDLPHAVRHHPRSRGRAGRDPDAIEITAGSAEVMGEDPVGAVQELAAIGVDRVVVPSFIFLRSPADDLAAFAEKAIAPTATSGV